MYIGIYYMTTVTDIQKLIIDKLLGLMIDKSSNLVEAVQLLDSFLALYADKLGGNYTVNIRELPNGFPEITLTNRIMH